MREWPAVITAKFPPHPRASVLRPWWRWDPEDWWVRSDGTWTVGTAVPRLCNREDMAACDKDHPIQHPGFREGQVWANEDGEVLTVHSVTSTGPWVAVIVSEPVGEHPLPAGGVAKIVRWGFVPSPLPPDYMYLVADPACSWLAPWAPA